MFTNRALPAGCGEQFLLFLPLLLFFLLLPLPPFSYFLRFKWLFGFWFLSLIKSMTFEYWTIITYDEYRQLFMVYKCWCMYVFLSKLFYWTFCWIYVYLGYWLLVFLFSFQFCVYEVSLVDSYEIHGRNFRLLFLFHYF